MPACIDSKFSLDLVKNYFAQLNPIANRIANDIEETKMNYGQLWCTLNPNEQNDIINETLIRPELSLRYFDNFSSSSSSSAASSTSTPSTCGAQRTQSSKSASADSLAAVVLKNLNDTLGRTKNDNEKSTKAVAKNTKKPNEQIKQYYAYDGRNLRTFALQKVALKIVHDDVLGVYRDEHSMPFCYRTKSQMNLLLFNDDGNSKGANNYRPPQRDDEICLLNASFRAIKKTAAVEQQEVPKHDKTSIENYKKLQNELKLNLRRDSKDKLQNGANEPKPQTQPYERLDNQKPNAINLPKVHKTQPTRPQVKPPPAPVPVPNAAANAATNGNEKKSIIVDCKSLESNLNARNHNESRLKSYLNANTAGSSMTYAVYSDTFYDHGERTNLMQNFGSSSGSGILTASSSSAATSDDDDEKTLCEEVKLLDNDANLRKGFDFLNNW